MKLIIHRGTKEIGGSCVELKSARTRIIVDLGIPLVDAKKERFNTNVLEGKTIPQLKKLGILPQVKGLYRNEKKSIDAIFISHCHLDHYGFLRYVHPEIPVYMSQGSSRLIEASNMFLPQKTTGFKAVVIEKRKKIKVGDFSITAYLVDHSGFDALAFVIQSDKKRLFYSGDFRGHGRKSALFERMINNPPRNIDCLVMEGTMFGRGGQKFKNETDIEKKMVKMLRNKKNITFFFSSSQNIDRLVSAYRACLQTDTTFVIDVYTAFILHILGSVSKHLPQYNWKNVRVKFFKSHVDSLAKTEYKNLIYKFNTEKIKIEEIKQKREKILMILRDNSLFPIMMKSLGETAGMAIIYSMWEGYLKDEFVRNCKEKGISITQIHTAGHAIGKDLKQFAAALNPKTLVPIHTFEPQEFLGLHKNVKILKDKEVFEV
jgi:ribonuclease J